MNLSKNKKGETILETIIAMGILAIGITLASSIIGSSLRNINASKNRIIAINIAREGIEAMRNIRDTNWLKFSSNRRACWNHDPVLDTCDVNNPNPILPGDYLIYKDTTQKWQLDDLLVADGDGTELPQSGSTGETFRDTDENITYIWLWGAWIDKSTLWLVDIDTNVDTDKDFIQDNDPDAYNHIFVIGDDALGEEIKRTVFKRFITIEYLEDGGAPGTPADNRMRITAKVSWQEGKNQFSTQLSTQITDYLGRENLN